MSNDKLAEALRRTCRKMKTFSRTGVLDGAVAVWVDEIESAIAAHATEAAQPKIGDFDPRDSFAVRTNTVTLQRNATEAAQTMTPSELADRIARGEKWKLAEALRESFEKWFATQETYMANRLTRLPNGDYQWTETQFAWLAWQAHAAEAVQRPSAEWFDQRLHENLLPRKTEAAQAQAQNGEWPSIINEAADVLSDVTDMVGEATSKLPSSWRWSLIDDLHGIAGQIAAAPQPQAAVVALGAVLEVALSIMDASDPLNAARLRKMRDAAMAKESGR